MPVVLTTAPGVRRSGHEYNDRTGIAYEFPAGRYERWIVRGERFVYVAPRKGYFGCGVIGEVTGSAKPNHRVAEIVEYVEFPDHVALAGSDGTYYEADPTYWSTGNVYWAQGVRPLSDERFEAIVGAGTPTTTTAGPPPRPPRGGGGGGYASPEVARAVERYAVEAVLNQLRTDHPGQTVQEMPRNNPGFDIRVGQPNHPDLYVEVKGTQSSDPVFFMSDGEREFSRRNAAKYELFVIAGVDLVAQTHADMHRRSGAVDDDVAEMKAHQWKGRLLLP